MIGTMQSIASRRSACPCIPLPLPLPAAAAAAGAVDVAGVDAADLTGVLVL